MLGMRRNIAGGLLLVALAAAACSRPARPAAAVSPSPLPSLGRGVPTSYAEALPSDEVPETALVPADARLTGTWFLPPGAGAGEQIMVAWSRGEDPFLQENGFLVWEAFDQAPPWRVVYAFHDPARRGVLGVQLQFGELTGDEHPEALTFEATGGSGVCGFWRVVTTDEGATGEIYLRETCDEDLTIEDGHLILTTAIFETGDAHCCPSATRRTVRRWDGDRWVVVDREVTRNPPY